MLSMQSLQYFFLILLTPDNDFSEDMIQDIW